MVNKIEKFLTPNRYSRPQRKVGKILGIVVHWVNNPNTSAMANRNFFENRKNGTSDYGSAHYIVGLKGEVIQCIPETEMAYHVGSKTYPAEALRKLGSYPNSSTIGIEMCHIDDAGHFTADTYNTTVKLVAELLLKYNLGIDSLFRHYDVVGWKDCPRLFVNEESEWIRFKEEVQKEMESKTTHWAEKYWNALNDMGLVVNEQRFDDSITRGEVFALLYRLMEAMKK